MTRLAGATSMAKAALRARTASLRAGGSEFSGWKSVRVTRGIECLSGSFDLSVSERWASNGDPWPIEPEDECQILLGDEVVITGYVDRREPSFSRDEHSVSVSGRDRAAALVDCSAYVSTWQYWGVPLLPFAQGLAKPFGVPVALQPGLAAPVVSEHLSIEPGESVWEVLERACRFAGVLAISDGRGGIVLTRAGSERCSTALVEGENILSASASFDGSQRFRRYVVTGQSAGLDTFMGDSAATVRGSAEDPSVKRSERVLVVRSEAGVTPALAKKRAQWEAIVRAARAESCTVRVQGWTQADGTLWPVNRLVRVRSPLLGIDGELLVAQATYSLDEHSGTTTELRLMRSDAFIPEPYVPKVIAWGELVGGVR